MVTIKLEMDLCSYHKTCKQYITKH